MNVIIIHGAAFLDKEKLSLGAPPQNKRHWISWTREKLIEMSIKVETPLMPENWCPKYSKWREEFEKLIINENSILIGHSRGASFLVRWLGETKKKIKKLILIAPSKIVPNFYEECFKEFNNFEINTEIKSNIKKIVIFVSNDDEKIIKSAELLNKKLNSEYIYLKNKGHFIEKHMGTKEFPELLGEILK